MRVLGIAIVAAAMVAAGCSKAGSEDYLSREQAEFEKWMAKNHPEVTTKLDNGMYIERLRGDGTGAKPEAGKSWMLLDYAVRDIHGNVIATRDPEVAKQEGTFTRVTHYVPHYAIFYPEQRYFTAGEYEALKDMAAGDSVRIYLPSTLAYSTAQISFGSGFEGWYYSALNPKNSLSGVSLSGRTAIIDLALREIVSDPEERELQQVMARATQESMKLANDTIPGLYYKIVEDDTDAEVIGADSTVYVSYECRFLDGSLVATNLERVAYEAWGDFGPSTYTGVTATTGGTLSLGTALHTIIENGHLRYNSTLRAVFISDFGYGTTGKTGSSTATPPTPTVYSYTPLLIEVKTMKKDYGEEEDEE
jgi:hypothetical protein